MFYGENLISIGGFKELFGDAYPPLAECKKDISSEKKKKIITYLKAGKEYASSPTILRDVMTGERLNEPLELLTYGEFSWRSDIAYYVKNYGFVPDEAFVKKVMNEPS